MIADYGARWGIKREGRLHQTMKVKKHGRQAKSVFGYSLDYLRSMLTDLDLKSDEFVHSLKFLFCT